MAVLTGTWAEAPFWLLWTYCCDHGCPNICPSVCSQLFGACPSCGIAGPCGNSVFDIFRDRQTATAAAPLAIPIRCARGFWFLQIGGRSISCSRSRGWGTGLGEVTCAHTAHMQTRIWAWWSDGLPLEPLTQTQDEVQRPWDAVQGTVHGFKPRPSAVKAHVVKHLGLNISVCFFPCLSKFML